MNNFPNEVLVLLKAAVSVSDKSDSDGETEMESDQCLYYFNH